MSVRLNPSILSADFAKFADEFESISNCDAIHVDVMDNHFVPNLTFGYPVVKRLQEISTRPLDVHLMIENVDEWAPKYAALGVFSVTFHHEAAQDSVETAKRIREVGSRAGLAIKPGTRFEDVAGILEHFDQLLVMTVEPGFGGQSLIESTLQKVSEARFHLDSNDLRVWLQVDGGIDEENIERIAALGADTFVAGSAVFKAQDRRAQINTLRTLAEKGHSHFH
jgi:ribulose-phosphate 3-epimerase